MGPWVYPLTYQFIINTSTGMGYCTNLLNGCGYRYGYHQMVSIPVGYVTNGYKYTCFDTLKLR